MKQSDEGGGSRQVLRAMWKDLGLQDKPGLPPAPAPRWAVSSQDGRHLPRGRRLEQDPVTTRVSLLGQGQPPLSWAVVSLPKPRCSLTKEGTGASVAAG